MAPVEGQSLPELDADQYASLVAGATNEQLEEGLAQNREILLDQVFQRMPGRFQADKAGDLNAVIEWRIRRPHDAEPDCWQVVIENGTCRTVRDGDAEPTVSFTVGGVDFVKLVTGNASGPMLFTFGRLRIQGDLMLAARVQGFFEMSRSPS
jgi:predicted lipid carrier protein YhbT